MFDIKILREDNNEQVLTFQHKIEKFGHQFERVVGYSLMTWDNLVFELPASCVYELLSSEPYKIECKGYIDFTAHARCVQYLLMSDYKTGQFTFKVTSVSQMIVPEVFDYRKAYERAMAIVKQ